MREDHKANVLRGYRDMDSLAMSRIKTFSRRRLLACARHLDPARVDRYVSLNLHLK